jgi:hypothetical protein
LPELPFCGFLILRKKKTQQTRGATVREHRNDSDFFQLIDRKNFDELVAKWEMDKGVRSFSTWEFTCALINCLTYRLDSYRKIEETLGIPRSTFGDALKKRFHGFFRELCDHILLQIKGRTGARKVKRAIREVLAIDSTECRVHGSLFSLNGWRPKHSKEHNGACKLHVVYNVDNEWIDDFRVSGVRKHDSPISLQFEILPNKTYVFDRAYNDLGFWLKIIKAKNH